MKPVRIIVLAVAAVSAIGLALLVRGMLSGKPTSQADAATPISQPVARPTTKVLVAKRDLRVGERLAQDDMEWQDWPAETVNAAFITDGSVEAAAPAAATAAAPADKGKKDDPKAAKPKNDAVTQVTRAVERLSGGGAKTALVGAVVREPFLAGEPIVDRKLVRAGESGYLAVVLQPGMRAMSIPVTVETGAGGFILPGDRVDVVLAAQVNDSEREDGSPQKAFSSATVLRNVKVLAIDQQTSVDRGATTVVGATATLEVGQRESEALALAKSMGTLSLALRSYADVGGPSGLGEDLVAAQRGGGAGGSVRVYRGAQQPSSVAVN